MSNEDTHNLGDGSITTEGKKLYATLVTQDGRCPDDPIVQMEQDVFVHETMAVMYALRQSFLGKDYFTMGAILRDDVRPH